MLLSYMVVLSQAEKYTMWWYIDMERSAFVYTNNRYPVQVSHLGGSLFFNCNISKLSFFIKSWKIEVKQKQQENTDIFKKCLFFSLWYEFSYFLFNALILSYNSTLWWENSYK